MSENQMCQITASVGQLTMSEEFLMRAIECLTEEDSQVIAPETDTVAFTACQQVAHIAWSVDWFVEGAFDPKGFKMDFEGEMEKIKAVTSPDVARKMVKDSYARAIARISAASMEELMKPLPEGPVMGGCPRISIVGGIVEHTAHHRGALGIYARIAGKTPAMPYV